MPMGPPFRALNHVMNTNTQFNDHGMVRTVVGLTIVLAALIGGCSPQFETPIEGVYAIDRDVSERLLNERLGRTGADEFETQGLKSLLTHVRYRQSYLCLQLDDEGRCLVQWDIIDGKAQHEDTAGRWETVPAWGATGQEPAELIRLDLEEGTEMRPAVIYARLVPPDSIELLGLPGVIGFPALPVLRFNKVDVAPAPMPQAE